MRINESDSQSCSGNLCELMSLTSLAFLAATIDDPTGSFFYSACVTLRRRPIAAECMYMKPLVIIECGILDI